MSSVFSMFYEYLVDLLAIAFQYLMVRIEISFASEYAGQEQVFMCAGSEF